jgi:cytochrome c oxidase subunit 2
VRRVFLALPAVLLLALLTAGAALADNGLAPVTPESPNANAIRQTYFVILIVTAGIFFLVEGALVLFIFRFRSRGRDRSVEGAQIHGASRLEQSFTIVPLLILAGIATFIFVKLPTIKDVPPAGAAGALHISVTGHQYYWEFRYPNGDIAIRDMVVPVNQVVTLDVVSPDVIHSWWAPALGGKIDAIPGRTNHTWFKAEKEGTYEVRCAEFCGLEHAHMLGSVKVVSLAAYHHFLAQQQGVSHALGKEIFQGVCATCHGMAGQGDYGPPLINNGTLADSKALAMLLRNGKNKMPAVGADWTPEEMQAAKDYLKARFTSGG